MSDDNGIFRSLFGDELASFLERCDRGHPDLKVDPYSSFLAECDEFLRAASFCESAGLRKPLELLREHSPRFLENLVCKARVLKPAHRTAARRSKRRSSIKIKSLRAELEASAEDLPPSFDAFKSAECPQATRWASIASRFDSIGCSSMASSARRLAGDYDCGELGFRRMPLRRAALILCRACGVGHDSEAEVSVIPAVDCDLTGSCAQAADSSDAFLEGFAFFDHHVILSLDECGRVLLGDRDGECYFLFSD